MSRFVTPLLLSKSPISGTAEIELSADGVVFGKCFSSETEFTSFIECPVAILRQDSISEFLLDDINQILDGCLADRYKKLNSLFASSGLYASSVTDRNETDTFIFYEAIALVLSRQPQILK